MRDAKMMLMDRREEVIANIRANAEAGNLNAKVEVDDPTLTAQEKRRLIEEHLRQRGTAEYRLKRGVARAIANAATWMVNRTTTVRGIEKIAGIKTGAIVTSNHFSPIDNTVVRHTMRKVGKRHLPIVGQETNLAMPSLFGFLMRYADIIPISSDLHYVANDFERLLHAEVEAGSFVLIYPEQEMWFNYRKPRPGKRGAYHYAASFGVPVISCFVEIVDRQDLQAPNFVEVGYVMHVLDPIWPDPAKSVRENSVEMCRRDYEQKVSAYEQAYQRPLDYRFTPDDIAGWVPTPAGEAAVMRARGIEEVPGEQEQPGALGAARTA